MCTVQGAWRQSRKSQRSVSNLFKFRTLYQAQSCHLLCRRSRCYEEPVPSSFRSTCYSTWTEVVVWALLRCLGSVFVSDMHKPRVLSCCSIDIQSLLLDTCHFCRAIFHIGISRIYLMFSSSDFDMRVAHSQIVSVWFAGCHISDW